REKIREEMAWLGFGQVGGGVLAHPSRNVADTRSQLDDLQIDGRAVILRAASEGAAADQTLLREGWDLAELSRGYQRFVSSFESVHAVLNARTAPPAETAFVIRT